MPAIAACFVCSSDPYSLLTPDSQFPVARNTRLPHLNRSNTGWFTAASRRRILSLSPLWGWDMKKTAQLAARVSRAQKILSIRRTLAVIYRLERRLKERTDLLDAARASRH